MTASVRNLIFLAAAVFFPFAAHAQTGNPDVFFDITFDSVVDSINLSGTADLPLGEAGAVVPTNVTLTSTRANHNTTRSNKIRPAANTDTFEPDDFEGQVFELDSSWVLDFDLSFTPQGTPFGSEFSSLGDNIAVQPVNDPPTVTLSEATSIVFDAGAPDFGLLRTGRDGGGHKKWIDVLSWSRSLSSSGGVLNIEIADSSTGFVLDEVLGSDVYGTFPNGNLRHEFDVSLSLEGTLNGLPFAIQGLTGTVVEEATLSVTLVPEPCASAIALLAFAWSGVSRRR